MSHRYAIGVVGYSAQTFDPTVAKRLVTLGIFSLIRAAGLDVADVEIVSGYTALGIPKLAYQVAEAIGARTVGIACAKAGQHPVWPVDEVEIVGEAWGDESDAFLDRCDALLRIGGGGQSHAEAEQFRRRFKGKPIFELPLPTV